MSKLKIVGTTVATAALGLTVALGAAPATAQQNTTPPQKATAPQSNMHSESEISGVIVSTTPTSMVVRENDGTTKTVIYHQSTVTDPPGAGAFNAGQQVVIDGYDDNGSFAAKEIWTPDSMTKGQPAANVESGTN